MIITSSTSVMTFHQNGLLFTFAYSFCLYASDAFVAAGPAAYTTITNTIDIMGAVESTQENNAGVHGAENISRTLLPMQIEKLPSLSGIQDAAARAGPSSAHITASSGPSIRIFSSSSESEAPNIRTISYSAPGDVFISHGSTGSSYVLSSANYRQIKHPVIYSSFVSAGEDRDKENSHSRSIINQVAANNPATPATGIYGYIGHPGYATTSRNLETAIKQLVDGISSAVSYAVNINLAGIGTG